jgi:hypothetical protein
MEADNQHLDFLISQYVDGCLEGSNKKLVEHKMLTDPAARKLYVEHRETQDLLDDWGSRIPLINWDEMEQKLAGRLEADAQVQQRQWQFRRRLKPWAVAAGLLVAVGVGYAWHAMSPGKVAPGSGTPEAVVTNVPRTSVEYPDLRRPRVPSHEGIRIEEGGPGGRTVESRNVAEISPPADATAYTSLMASVRFGLGVSDEGKMAPNGAVAADVPLRKDEGDAPR